MAELFINNAKFINRQAAVGGSWMPDYPRVPFRAGDKFKLHIIAKRDNCEKLKQLLQDTECSLQVGQEQVPCLFHDCELVRFYKTDTYFGYIILSSKNQQLCEYIYYDIMVRDLILLSDQIKDWGIRLLNDFYDTKVNIY